MPTLVPDGVSVRPVITAPSPWTRPAEDQCGVGARLMIPTLVYPTYACNENGGWGWTATVIARKWSIKANGKVTSPLRFGQAQHLRLAHPASIILPR
eukprot:39363-Pleurochrysis_carterae.AAC.1